MKPNTYVLDNGVSQTLTDAMTTKNISYQLVSSYIHHANLAERAIQTIKNHIKAKIVTINPYSPLFRMGSTTSSSSDYIKSTLIIKH